MSDNYETEREKLYQEWKNKRYDGQALCSKETIKKLKVISNENFRCFVEYQDYCINDSNMDIGTFKTRRSKIIDFLLPDNIKGVNVLKISQEIIEDYFISYLKQESDNTYNARLSYIKQFIEFFSDRMENELDFNSLRLKKDEIVESELYVKKSLTAQQVALCRNEYRNDLKKLYIFEMFYYTQFNKEELKKITYSDFDIIDSSISFQGKKAYVPNNLVNIIEKIKDDPILARNYDVDYLIEQMKEELKKYGIMNFKPKDLTETRNAVYWRCPQCGSEYEAIIDNWCAKQYTEDGNLWIVCRENCGKND